MNLSKASLLSMNILSQRSSRGSKASGVSLLACEDGGICAESGIKLDASGAIGSKEGYEEAYKDACEDDCKSIRGLFGLPLPLEVASRLPLLPAVRVLSRGVLETLARARKRVEVLL